MIRNHAPTLVRPYDDAIPPVLLEQVRRRRETPDGDCHRVRYETRAFGDEKALYPWGKMRAGDFFFIDLKGRKPESVRSRLKNVALRRDIEITVVRWNVGTSIAPREGLRVTLSFDGQVSRMRAALGLKQPNLLSKRGTSGGQQP